MSVAGYDGKTGRTTLSPPNILLTSAGRKIVMYEALRNAVWKFLPQSMTIAGDTEAITPIQSVADRFWQMPLLEERNTSYLLDQLLGLGVSLVIPSRDGELSFWAKARKELESEGVEVMVSDANSVDICRDKLAFWRWADQMGFPVIPTSDDAEDICCERLVVKERFGSGSKNVSIDVSSAEAKNLARELKNPIFQPFVAGEEISIDAYLDKDSGIHGLVLRKRDLVRDGESVITTTFRNSEYEGQARYILESLRLRGPVVMQAVSSSEGLQVIELNPRFGGVSTASMAVGLDIFDWMIQESFFPDRELPRFVRSQKEIRLFRISKDLVTEWQ